jgi:hypothetical protein
MYFFLTARGPTIWDLDQVLARDSVPRTKQYEVSLARLIRRRTSAAIAGRIQNHLSALYTKLL